MISIAILLAVGLASPPDQKLERQNWCQNLPTQDHELSEWKDAKIEFVKSGALRVALRMLRKKSVRSLDKGPYKRLVDGPALIPRGYKAYLVRAGFMATVDVIKSSVANRGRGAAYSVYEYGKDTVNVTSMLTAFNKEQVPANFPLILLSRRLVRNVTVTCIGGA